jgi:hypothetical protein
MSLFELFYCVFTILCAYFLGHSLAHRWGTIGWLVGTPLGLLMGFLLPEGILRLYYRFIPTRSKCRRGKCGEADYSVVRTGPEGHVVQCQCGDKYLKRYVKKGSLSGSSWKTVPYAPTWRENTFESRGQMSVNSVLS